jgi:hypothetical protein
VVIDSAKAVLVLMYDALVVTLLEPCDDSVACVATAVRDAVPLCEIVWLVVVALVEAGVEPSVEDIVGALTLVNASRLSVATLRLTNLEAVHDAPPPI